MFIFKKALSVTYPKPVEGADFRFLSNEKFQISLTGVWKIDSDHYHIFLKKFPIRIVSKADIILNVRRQISYINLIEGFLILRAVLKSFILLLT